MILKLIETNDTPKIGDLVKDWIYENLYIIKSEADLHFAKEDKVVKPYGISYEVAKRGEYYYDLDSNSIIKSVSRDAPIDSKKVNILPEQFNYQEIVDLGLKDGDELNVALFYDGKAVLSNISKPTPVTYTEGDMEEAFKAGASFGIYIGRYDDDDIKKAPNFKEWFNLNKKKQ
jgi:hypothetical protein